MTIIVVTLDSRALKDRLVGGLKEKEHRDFWVFRDRSKNVIFRFFGVEKFSKIFISSSRCFSKFRENRLEKFKFSRNSQVTRDHFMNFFLMLICLLDINLDCIEDDLWIARKFQFCKTIISKFWKILELEMKILINSSTPKNPNITFLDRSRKTQKSRCSFSFKPSSSHFIILLIKWISVLSKEYIRRVCFH